MSQERLILFLLQNLVFELIIDHVMIHVYDMKDFLDIKLTLLIKHVL